MTGIGERGIMEGIVVLAIVRGVRNLLRQELEKDVLGERDNTAGPK